MAIDTAEKRRSILSFGRPGFTIPVADGSFDAGNRAHLLGLYSGIALSGEVDVGDPDQFWYAVNRGRLWTADERSREWSAALRPKTWTVTIP